MDPFAAIFLRNTRRQRGRPEPAPQLELPDFGPTTIYDFQSPTPVKTPTTFDCQICLESEPDTELISPEVCGHKFGRACLQAYVTTWLGDGRYPIPCPSCYINPDFGPGKVLTRELIADLGASEADLAQWDQLELALTCVQLRCPECKQTRLIQRKRLARQKFGRIKCKSSGCNQGWCRKCFAALGPRGRHVCDGDKALDELVKTNGWTRCPGCHIAVQKVSGCEHITCAACQVHFCYTCGIDIGKPERGDNVYGHFSNCTGRPNTGVIRRRWFRWGRS